LKSLTNLVVAIHSESAYKESSSKEIQMKAKEAIAKIEEIMGLEYDGFGEPMDPMERFAMIFGVLERYKESQDAPS
jgi:hypothetical protein